MEAVRIIHAHGHGVLHERLFQAMSMVYADSRHTMELYDKNTGSHVARTDVPFTGAPMEDFMRRAGELVPLENPIFPHLARRDPRPVRISDFVTHRQFCRTHLYQEIFRNVSGRHQMAIPVYSAACVGALTVNGLGRRDYTEEDLTLASLLAPQIATAFEADQLLQKLAPELETAAPVDFTLLRRLGLSRREAEVMHWMAQGKRDGEIAIILGISARTTNHHVRAILRKLGAETRTAAVMMAVQRGALAEHPDER